MRFPEPHAESIPTIVIIEQMCYKCNPQFPVFVRKIKWGLGGNFGIASTRHLFAGRLEGVGSLFETTQSPGIHIRDVSP